MCYFNETEYKSQYEGNNVYVSQLVWINVKSTRHVIPHEYSV